MDKSKDEIINEMIKKLEEKLHEQNDQNNDTNNNLIECENEVDYWGAKINSSTGEPVGKHTSTKITNKNEVIYRSALERYTFDLLDNWDSVKAYEVESLSIPYTYNFNCHTYIPDLVLIYKNGRKKIVELKGKNFINSKMNLAKYEAGNKFAKENGYTFAVWTWDDVKRIKNKYNLHSNIDEVYNKHPEEFWKDQKRKKVNKLSQERSMKSFEQRFSSAPTNKSSKGTETENVIFLIIIVLTIIFLAISKISG